MTITVDSTTDTPEQVLAAKGAAKTVVEVPAKEPPVVEKAATTETPKVEKVAESDPAKPEVVTTEVDPNLPLAPKKKGGFQKKIDKLTRKITALEQDNVVLRQQRVPLSVETKPVVELKSTVPTGKPAAENFDTHAEFIEALTTWTTKETLKAAAADTRKVNEANARQVRLAEWNKRVDAARKVHDDFDDVMDGDVPVSPVMRESLVDSEHGAEMAYYLATNPAEANRIAQLPPLAAAREMGRVEGQFAKPAVAKTVETGGALKPKPVAPISGKGGVPTQKPLDEMPYQEFKKARNQQLSQRS